MNRIVKTFILSLAVAATTLSAIPLANAGSRWEHRRHHRHGDAIVAGVAGLAVGALIAGAASQRRYVDPYYGGGYYPPAPRVRYYRDYEPRYYRPAPPRYYRVQQPRYYGGLEPWSREWYRYCASRYRSFDPGSGTFVTYGGQRRFCVAN